MDKKPRLCQTIAYKSKLCNSLRVVNSCQQTRYFAAWSMSIHQLALLFRRYTSEIYTKKINKEYNSDRAKSNVKIEGTLKVSLEIQTLGAVL